MYKKQFLKIGKRKLSGGIFAGLMILGVLSGTVMAGNKQIHFILMKRQVECGDRRKFGQSKMLHLYMCFIKEIIRHILGCIAVPQIILLVPHLLMLQWG